MGSHLAVTMDHFSLTVSVWERASPSTETSHLTLLRDGLPSNSWIRYGCRQWSTWRPVPAAKASPALCLNLRSLKFSKCAAGRRRYFRIWGLETLILKSRAWQSSERLYSPVPADTSAPGSLAQQKG